MDRPAEFREDAPEALALEREQRLQDCRILLRASTYDRKKAIALPKPWTEQDLTSLRWVDALARTGHVGAQRLLGSVLEDRERFEPAMPLAPELFESLAKDYPQIALCVIARECKKPAPSAEILRHWLPFMPAGGTSAAAAVDEIARIRPLSEADGEVIRSSISLINRSSSLGRRDSAEEVIADTLWRCAKRGGAGAQRLAARAAELGSAEARFEYLLAGDTRFAADDDTWWGELCAALREASGIAPLTDAEKYYFREQLEIVVRQGPRSRPDGDERMRARILHHLAKSRFRYGDREVGARLRLRAAELGCIEAIAASLEHGADRVVAWLEAGGPEARAAAGKLREIFAVTGGMAPADLAPKLEQVRELFWRASGIGRIRKALCLRTGAAVELGRIGPVDPELAAGWYSLGLAGAQRNAAGKPSATFCWEVAVAFDHAEPEFVYDEPKLAVAWYDRGVRLGGQLCLQRLLRAGATGDLGLARDADRALERVNAFFSAPGHHLDHNHTGATIGVLRNDAPKNDVKWALIADRLMSPELRASTATRGGDSIDTRLALVKEYRRMGDHARAQEIVAQILLYGTPEEKAKAKEVV